MRRHYQGFDKLRFCASVFGWAVGALTGRIDGLK